MVRYGKFEYTEYTDRYKVSTMANISQQQLVKSQEKV